MFEFIFSAPFLVGLALGASGGAFVGVLMARRSSTANRIVDQIKAEYEARLARLRANSNHPED